MPRHRRILIALIAVTVGLLTVAGGLVAVRPAAADELSDVQEKLSLTRERIDAARAEAKTLDGQLESLDARLTSIDGKLAALGSEIAVLQEKLDITEEKLAVVRKQLRLKKLELAGAERELALQEAAFEQRVVLTYKTREIDYLDIVLESSSFDDLVTRLRLVRELVGSDNDLVAQLEKTRARVEREKTEVADREQEVSDLAHELQTQNDRLLALQAAEQQQRAEAAAARADKGQALAAVEQNLEELEKQERDLLAESRALASVISGGSSSGGGSGVLIWPCSGTVVSDFGWRTHPILGIELFHTGIDIAAPYGTPIKAAASGKVTMAAWYGGYGNCTIIDHGDGLSTLYAHESSFKVGTGQSVSQGQLIGYVGSTGLSTGPHLHFETRVNGEPVDPMRYLP
ncbi:MAG: peptidoglycan DD-metalloendopeptidase family protein [Thermoleophilia bacterium]|nr:peptidoglycan DD-metalloendopeptidase family protein [Thermoleophilia bacterium]